MTYCMFMLFESYFPEKVVKMKTAQQVVHGNIIVSRYESNYNPEGNYY